MRPSFQRRSGVNIPRAASTADFADHWTATQPRARTTAAILVDEFGSGNLLPAGPQLHPTAAVAPRCPPGQSGGQYRRIITITTNLAVGTPAFGQRQQRQSQRAANPIHRHGQWAHLRDVRPGGGFGHSVAERWDSRFRQLCICKLNLHRNQQHHHHNTTEWFNAEQQCPSQGQYVPATAGAVAQSAGNGLVK